MGKLCNTGCNNRYTFNIHRKYKIVPSFTADLNVDNLSHDLTNPGNARQYMSHLLGKLLSPNLVRLTGVLKAITENAHVSRCDLAIVNMLFTFLEDMLCTTLKASTLQRSILSTSSQGMPVCSCRC